MKTKQFFSNLILIVVFLFGASAYGTDSRGRYTLNKSWSNCFFQSQLYGQLKFSIYENVKDESLSEGLHLFALMIDDETFSDYLLTGIRVKEEFDERGEIFFQAQIEHNQASWTIRWKYNDNRPFVSVADLEKKRPLKTEKLRGRCAE